jgi:hypothetical protein
MYNPYQPFINLMNANLSLFNRFVNSTEISRLVQESVNRAMAIPQESVAKAAQTHAFEELTRGLADNVTRFTQEHVNGLSQSMAQTQNVLSRQAERGTRRLERLTESAQQATNQVADAATGQAEEATDGAQDAALRLANGGHERARNSRQAKQ